ncbi:MAG: CvpA family protein [Candidatus Syntrophonatronum acetioxidans]|uniref:CvpA family protein n=1 Tax=Candidatus Syntrophonatronum acetioxidans TaxID=1795816 RepID=A0A424YER7_9FIRM|nr:MAG: CvpA family protein [Candidatus Syntrophonatronum acetioxidans]
MGYLNWLDLLILIMLLLFLSRGISIGLIGSVFEVLSILVGMLAASKYYTLAGNYIMGIIPIPEGLADVISFVGIFMLVSALVMAGGSLISFITRFSFIKFLDRVGGSITGAVVGMGVAGIILLLLTTFPLVDGFDSRVEESHLASPLVNLMEGLYEKSSELLPVDFPRLAFYPEHLTSYSREGPAFKSINFQDLEGSTCLNCEGKVEFEGYLNTGGRHVSPKFTCFDCGRTSDGCQTFEGYHVMYDGCPVVLGRQGYRFDCGIWTNGNFVRPTGECPYCGERGRAHDTNQEERYILLP